MRRIRSPVIDPAINAPTTFPPDNATLDHFAVLIVKLVLSQSLFPRRNGDGGTVGSAARTRDEHARRSQAESANPRAIAENSTYYDHGPSSSELTRY